MQAAGAELWLTIHFHTELGVRAGRGLVPLVCRAGVNRHGWRCRPLIGRAGRNRQLPANHSPASPVSPYKGMEWWCGWQNESVLYCLIRAEQLCTVHRRPTPAGRWTSLLESTAASVTNNTLMRREVTQSSPANCRPPNSFGLNHSACRVLGWQDKGLNCCNK